jgi:thioredoxin-related protein
MCSLTTVPDQGHAARTGTTRPRGLNSLTSPLILPVFALLISLASAITSAADWSQVNRDRFNEDAVPVNIVNPDWFKHSFLDLRGDLADAKKAGKLGIVLFLSAPQCSYCRAFLDFTFGDPGIRRDLTKHFDVIGLEVISDNEITDTNGKAWTMKQFVVEEKAYVTPTLIFLRHDGRRMLRIVGYYPPEKFRGVLTYLLDGHYEREPLGAFLAKREAAARTATGPMLRDAELFSPPPHVLDRRAAPAPRPLLVLLERPDCASCEQFHRKVLQEPSIRALIRKYDAIQLDMTDTRSWVVLPTGERLSPKQWAERLDAAYAPALVFFDERGKEVYRLDSELLRERTEGSLQLVLEKGYLDEPQLQRWRKQKRQSVLP